MSDRRIAFEEIRRDQVIEVVGDLMWRRLLFAPFGLLVVYFMWRHDPVPWRRNALTACWLIVMVVVTTTAVRLRQRRIGMRGVQLNFLVMAVVMGGAIGVLGGIDSPIAPAALALAVVTPLALPGRFALITILGMVAAIAAATVAQATGHLSIPLPPYLSGEGYTSPRTMLWWRGGILVWTMLGLLYIAGRLRRGMDEVALRSLRARDEVLADHDEQLRAMTTLAGEIAHELKNPLASVKGLAALVAKSVDGQAAEQLAVLRREADRMQGILEEFLNFSRPLVPLQQEEVVVAALAADVIELHTAMALERAVRVELIEQGEQRVRCDRRKVKQVLINLLQNALDATPRGGHVELRLSTTTTSLHLEVVDDGAGLAPQIAERVFQPGVTTKAGGSGLGLTVSRLLARQHGGELVLRSAGKGCTAELVLPLRGVEVGS